MKLNDHLRHLVQAFLRNHDRLATESGQLRRAAVALALVEEGRGANLPGIRSPTAWSTNAALLLTRRAAGLRKHPGQWALPGGSVDPGETVEEAALRELREEVGLVVTADRILGILDDFTTRSGFVVTPVVVWVGIAHDLIAGEAEVSSIHRIPVSEFMRDDAPWLDPVEDSVHPALRMPVGDTWIAAPTGAILYQFREVCVAGRSTRVAHFEQPMFARR
jgi:8-oxo-dGTP pyrophosphatase MutT (NUDIX family)